MALTVIEHLLNTESSNSLYQDIYIQVYIYIYILFSLFYSYLVIVNQVYVIMQLNQ